MSFNIRYPNPEDGAHYWPHRIPAVVLAMRVREFDFIGLQEAKRGQLDSLNQAMPEFGEVGVGRDDGKTAGEYSAIFYRQDRWQVVASGTFWLSESPEQQGSMAWGAKIPRICTWGHFLRKADAREIFLANTHWDHQSAEARLQSGKLLATKLPALAEKRPWLLLGDFNCAPESPALRPLRQELKLRHAYLEKNPKPDAAKWGTFHTFTGNTDRGHIDHIFLPNGWDLRHVEILQKQFPAKSGPLWPSDHFPVFAELAWPAP
jgi:endonuclease/exonuclease/phosphatase family metal-dependent hydrolase